jgi:hypothetical protein
VTCGMSDFPDFMPFSHSPRRFSGKKNLSLKTRYVSFFLFTRIFKPDNVQKKRFFVFFFVKKDQFFGFSSKKAHFFKLNQHKTGIKIQNMKI